MQASHVMKHCLIWGDKQFNVCTVDDRKSIMVHVYSSSSGEMIGDVGGKKRKGSFSYFNLYSDSKMEIVGNITCT